MNRPLLRLLVALTALSLVACSEDTNDAVDSGTVADAGSAVDAGNNTTPDAGRDAGTPVPDAGVPDAGLPLTCDIANPASCPTGSQCVAYGSGGSLAGTKCFAGACSTLGQDCPANQKCTYGNIGGQTQRGCFPEGTVDEGGVCNGSSAVTDCKKGLICAGQRSADGGVIAFCKRFCAAPTDCATNETCAGALQLPGSQEVPLTCSAPAAECDPSAQNCPSSTDNCLPTTIGTLCLPAGTIPNGGACNADPTKCLKGSMCVNNACMVVCKFPDGTCPSPAACNQLTTEAGPLGDGGIGACF